MPVQVLIIDSSDIVRAGLSDILDSADGIDVIGETDNCTEAQAFIAEQQPDVVVLDLGSVDKRLDLILSIKQDIPETRLLVFTSKDCSDSARQLLAAGVDGYVMKEASSDEIVAAVKTVAAGRQIVSISEFGAFFTVDNARSNIRHIDRACHRGQKLSQREHEVLSRIARGRTNQQIADEMFLSVKTIETYRSRLTKKIGARSRAELFEFANSAGMLTETSNPD